jgi:hypothetical protein
MELRQGLLLSSTQQTKASILLTNLPPVGFILRKHLQTNTIAASFQHRYDVPMDTSTYKRAGSGPQTGIGLASCPALFVMQAQEETTPGYS